MVTEDEVGFGVGFFVEAGIFAVVGFFVGAFVGFFVGAFVGFFVGDFVVPSLLSLTTL